MVNGPSVFEPLMFYCNYIFYWHFEVNNYFWVSGGLDTSGGYSFPEFLKAIMPLLHSFLFFDEEVQVNGFKFLNDVTGASMSMITWAGLTGFKDVAEYFWCEFFLVYFFYFLLHVPNFNNFKLNNAIIDIIF